nr:MAG TPA: hypothetical protein [Caudoviricetes sp.]
MKILKRKSLTIKDTEGLNGLAVRSEALRTLRAPLLDAFDIYKSNVYYGIITETDEQHEAIVAWYHNLCDLKESAISEPPAGIRKYLKGGTKA